MHQIRLLVLLMKIQQRGFSSGSCQYLHEPILSAPENAISRLGAVYPRCVFRRGKSVL